MVETGDPVAAVLSEGIDMHAAIDRLQQQVAQR
jgi:hypothetical protein